MKYALIFIASLILLAVWYLIVLLRRWRAKEKQAQAELVEARQRLRNAEQLEELKQRVDKFAHDFNNLLTSILGNTELLLEKASGDENLESDLREIRAAGLHAASITQRLLGPGRPPESVAKSDEDERDPSPKGAETILVVDDDEQILRLVDEGLSSLGYRVLTANGGDAGLEVCRKERGAIQAIVSDVIMSGTNGPTFMAAARRLQPQAVTVYISGYAEDIVLWRRNAGERIPLVTKPFELHSLASVIREQLDQHANAES